MERDNVQETIIKEAELFVKEEVRPYVNEFEENQGISKELIKKMAEKGYLAAPFPKEYGGLELDPVYYGLFTEVFGKASDATRALITVHTSLVGQTLLRFGTSEQKEKWLPKMAKGEVIGAFGLSEPETGSDAKNVQTTWEEKEDCYVINGTKKWITFGHLADLFIIIASNQGKSTAFLVERSFEGVETKRVEGLMVARTTYLAEISLNQVCIPKENVLGKVNYGFEYIVSAALDYGRYSIAWAGVGLAQEALEAMVTYSRKREQFGQKLRNFQLVRGMIGDAVTKVHAARALCVRAGELRKEKNKDAIIETTMSKYYTSKVAVEVTSDALQVHGAIGFTSQYPVERLYREAKVLEIIEGSSQMQQEMISDYGLMRYFKRR
ncbi:acyl-CoA dehydrogenase family protein [Anaeromicropila populeti]|uniref:Acyl-CoA dehydrogenase n=1 Tax=Anaeromicropila populeti TaxID=37658 RepID=A0A1I6LG11_9FIRM|nr:acyl-CoA dehydrogenase family protein [Anaeromicropila populeti]SFS02445.1 hypothetical protein SAMN05661086_03275 [Anaeromicropila populeti]